MEGYEAQDLADLENQPGFDSRTLTIGYMGRVSQGAWEYFKGKYPTLSWRFYSGGLTSISTARGT